MIAAKPPGPASWIALAGASFMCAVPGLLGVHFVPLTSFYEEWLAAALGTAACAAMLAGMRGRAVAIPRTVLPLVGFLAVLGVQLAGGLIAYPQQATLAMLYVLFAMAMAWCGLQLREAAGLPRVGAVIAAALLAGGALNALAALVQSYASGSTLGGFVSPLAGPRVYGNLNQPNLLADQLALAAASLAYLHARGALRTAPAAALGLLLAAAMTLTGSRSVWLYVGWLIAWTLYARWRTGDRRFAAPAWGIAAGAGALAVLAFALPAVDVLGVQQAGSESGLGRLAAVSIESGRAGSEGVRLYYLRQAWLMFESAPLLGVGVGEFAWHFLQQSVQFAGVAVAGQERNAHDLVLQLLAETGVAGTASVLAALGLWLWGALRAPLDLERWWVVGAVGVVLLHSLVEYPLWYAHFLGPFALLVGLGETRALAPRRARLVVAALAATTLLGGLMLASLAHGFGELRRWVYLVPEEALRDPAVVRRQQAVVQRLQSTLLGPYVDLPLTSTIRLDGADLAPKLAFNGRVMRFSPIALVVFRQVVLLALAGRDEEAKRLLDSAAIVYPGELAAFGSDLERLAGRGLDVSAIAAHLAAIRARSGGKS